ncbi:Frataxin [Amniculicola lignicola CBS 123094]|uniref:ferroxidase n=1 Tax=Amniculicola lignicola CBS 123094 TaxID=1392246 RepID=A0A6A5WWF6_9PLEO|nr:Frataxin [Amniculicola lignicola CBS 123094]
MASRSMSQLGRVGLRRAIRTPIRHHAAIVAKAPTAVPIIAGRAHTNAAPIAAVRGFHSSTSFQAGIMPDTENPAPKESEASETPTQPTDITTKEFHQRADEFIDKLVAKLEAQQEGRPDLEVEYSAGVLEISVQPQGTYIINKQPPNKQIWLSSPESGPKRFDWVVLGESIDQKEGSGSGDWIYLRDQTSLTQLVKAELGVDVSVDFDAPS